MLKSHYEKIILLISALTALAFGLFLPLLSSMFSDGTAEELLGEGTGESFVFGENEAGLQTLELTKENGLMPGDSITFVSIGDENQAKAFPIQKIILESRSRLTVAMAKRKLPAGLFRDGCCFG